MSSIDLVILGMVIEKPRSAYDIQKDVEYHHFSRWTKISTPSIYKKVIQLEEKGLLQSVTVKESNMPEKAVYSLTASGEQEFEKLMREISTQPIRFFLDFNAVIVNLESLSPELQKECVENIAASVQELKAYLEQNIQEKEGLAEIPATGMAVLRQQLVLAEAIENWIAASVLPTE